MAVGSHVSAAYWASWVGPLEPPIRDYLLWGGLIVAVVALAIVLTRATKFGRRRRRGALMTDARYQTAVAQYHGAWEAPPDERLATALETLTSQGISARTARANLTFLCGIDREPRS